MKDKVRTPRASARWARSATPDPMPSGPPAQSKRWQWKSRFMAPSYPLAYPLAPASTGVFTLRAVSARGNAESEEDVRLGLGRLARAVAGAAGTCLVVLAAFAVGVAGTGAIATGADLPGSWIVTVGPANRTLFPGTEATMPYDVHNGTAGSLRLQSTTASVHVRGGIDGCRGDWFRISSNIVPTDVEVAPGD